MKFHEKPPWQIDLGPMPEREEMEERTMEGQAVRKRELTRSGKWANWEKGRQKALRERRDYFRKHPELKDDFSGV